MKKKKKLNNEYGQHLAHQEQPSHTHLSLFYLFIQSSYIFFKNIYMIGGSFKTIQKINAPPPALELMTFRLSHTLINTLIYYKIIKKYILR